MNLLINKAVIVALLCMSLVAQTFAGSAMACDMNMAEMNPQPNEIHKILSHDGTHVLVTGFSFSPHASAYVFEKTLHQAEIEHATCFSHERLTTSMLSFHHASMDQDCSQLCALFACSVPLLGKSLSAFTPVILFSVKSPDISGSVLPPQTALLYRPPIV